MTRMNVHKNWCSLRTAACVALCACTPVLLLADEDKDDRLALAAQAAVKLDLRMASAEAARDMNVRQDEAGWTVDAVVGAAELVYATLELSEADGQRKVEWILRTLRPVWDAAIIGLMPRHDLEQNEGYRRAVLMIAVLGQTRAPELLDFGQLRDPENAMYQMVCARNAFRSYDWQTVRKLIGQFGDDPKPAHLCQRYSLARMAMALRTMGRLDEEMERSLVLAATPPTDIGLCLEITSLLTISQHSPVLLVEDHFPEYSYEWRHRAGLFLALQMSEQPPVWRTFTPYVLLWQVSHATCGFQQFRATADLGKAVSKEQAAWYQRLARLIDKQFEQCNADDGVYRRLLTEGSPEEIRKYIADPIRYMEGRYESDRRGELAGEWLALWKDWEQLATKMHRSTGADSK
jgi:hypothetical protein